MPSPPYKLTPTITQLTYSSPSSTAWLWVDNPTGSPILCRIGGTDYPTEQSCDLFVSFASSFLVPSGGARDFAFIFDNVAALGSPIPQVTANIIIGYVGDAPPAIGGLQQNKQLYYDRPHLVPVTSLLNLSVSANAGTLGLLSVSGYTVPPARKTVVTAFDYEISRTAVATSLNSSNPFVQLFVSDPSPLGRGSSTLYLDSNKNYVGSSVFVSQKPDLPLLPGWNINVRYSNSDPGGSGSVLFIQANVYLYEFDA